MKKILAVTAVLIIIATAIVGCLYIFEILSYEKAISDLLKLVAAIGLLGGCSALIAFLVPSKNNPDS